MGCSEVGRCADCITGAFWSSDDPDRGAGVLHRVQPDPGGGRPVPAAQTAGLERTGQPAAAGPAHLATRAQAR